MSDIPAPAARRNFYGRVHGKTLRQSQKSYLAEDMDRWRLPGVTRDDNPGRVPVGLAALAAGRPCGLRSGSAGASIWCIRRR